MGLGKTIQTIALLLQVRKQEQSKFDTNGAVGPALLICPTSIVANWRREVEKFAPTVRSLVHHGNNRLAGDEFQAALNTYDLVITSYGTARRDVDLLQQYEWSDLILDEAQNIKTPSAKQTQAVRRLRGQNRVALTGTPVENRLSELWSIMEFLNPGYLGSREMFRQRYIIPIERYNDDERTDELRKLVQPFLLRRLKSDPTIISDLPEKNEMVVYCTLTREQAELYDKTVRDAFTKLQQTDGIQRRGLVLALLTKLKQITNHPAHFLKEGGPLTGRSGKLNRLTEMLDEALTVGDRALIFTQFVEMGHLLQRHLTETMGVETLFLHGATSANRRDRMVQSFQRKDGPPVFVLSLRAGGSGLNLTHANHVFHYDRWWNPAVENQATDRAFRIGQLRNVQVHKFVVAGSLEESIHDLIESKQALAHSVVGSGEEWLTEMNTEDLRDLLMLRYEGIEDE
jgi:SNF2 family DNA or RNA helicase